MRRPMLNDRSSILSLLETRRPAKPRELVGPGPTAEELERILDHRRAHARPRQAHPVALRHRRRRPARRRWRRCCRRRWRRKNPDATGRASREGGRVRALCRAAGRADLGAGRRPQDSRVGAGTVVRRGGNEPAAGRPCARLCRRLGDRLARLFRARSTRLLRPGRADRRLHLHRPRRRASSRSGRGPTLADVVQRVAAANT